MSDDIERALATIRTVETIIPIEGADKIVLVTLKDLGWRTVMQKAVAKPGLKVVYFEVDSLLDPGDARYSFLADSRFRVKTIRLRGAYSQGLAMPLSAFPEITSDEDEFDVTTMLNVGKYELADDIDLEGSKAGAFPGFLNKTGLKRIQTLSKKAFEEFIEHPADVTVKLDGSSTTFYLYQGKFGVCSRNRELSETTTNTLWKMARKYGMEEKLRGSGWPEIAISAELVGPKIQKNRAGFKSLALRVYRIFNITAARYFTWKETRAFINFVNSLPDDETLPLELVPYVGEMGNGFQKVESYVQFSKGRLLITHADDEPKREGIVIISKKDPNIAYKVLNPEYLVEFDA
jgi:RNA ligase (TIGR02306 family)